MKIQRKIRHITARFLAVMLLVTTLFTGFTPIDSYASVFRGRNIWTGGSEIILGQNRNYLYKWTDGFQMTFCIDPGNHMGNDVSAEAFRYHINDEDIPYIDDREDFVRLALICDWFDTRAGSVSAGNAAYAAAQGAVWAIMESDWESADSIIAILNRHIPGTSTKWAELKAYVNGTSSGSSTLPSWVSAEETTVPVTMMTLEDGVYQAQLDLTGCPELASVPWELPDSSWSKSVSGNTMTITYSGSGKPNAIVRGKAPASMNLADRNSQTLTLYVPSRSSDQSMIGAGLKGSGSELYIKLTGYYLPETDLEVEVFKHKETFQSHYNIDLEKYCAETGQTLEGVVFRVLEAFDSSQITNGLNQNCMTPGPVTWDDFKTCGQIITDVNGYGKHQDIKYYQYSKTYCDGHPEPEYLEAPDEIQDPVTGEVVNADEIQAVEDENIRLEELWQELIEQCEGTTDFHGMDSGEGLDAMLENRNRCYEEFINLKYDYTVQEITSRYGYILHNRHNDDEEIPVVRISSSEAGAQSSVITRQIRSCSTDIFYSTFREAEKPEVNVYATPAAAVEKLSLEESRRITWEEASPSSSHRRAAASPSDFQKWTTASPSDSTRKEVYRYTILQRDVGFAVRETGVELPEPKEDEVAPIRPQGTSDTAAFQFVVYNRRTEGELHINKRDLELYRKNPDESYGLTQGDATLEGAVYGLYAAADLVHPDGKSGVIFKQNDLVSIATTDKNGDASFMVITEESETSQGVTNEDGTWIGHPLLLGSYYVKEISRSEGYELSVYGIQLTESNRQGLGGEVLTQAGSVMAGALSHPIDGHDGSWNEFEVTNYKTEHGYDIIITGYPEGSTFFTSQLVETTAVEHVVVGSVQVPTGEFERAGAGEKKLDSGGNYIPVLDGAGNPVYDTAAPVAETYFVSDRRNVYPSGTATPTIDPVKWADTTIVDVDYVKEETNSMLGQTGFALLDDGDGDGAPWSILTLSGTTNQEIVEEILDWYTLNSFWDSAAVHRIYEDGGVYKVELFHDYRAVIAAAVYDPLSNTVYVRKDIRVTGGAGTSHMFIAYPVGEYVMNGSYVTVSPAKQVSGDVPFMACQEDYLEFCYQPVYETYLEGELRLDRNGNPIPVYETRFIYGDEVQTTVDYRLTPVTAVYDPATENYRIHVDNTINWTGVTEPNTTVYRAVTPESHIVVNGEEMYYSDYLTHVKGAGAGAFAPVNGVDEGSYIQTVNLVYPGQMEVFQDGGTRTAPVQVLQRVIKQAVKVTKDISQESYKENNTYRIHRDPFTVLFGGYSGAGKKFVPGFRFKLYRKSELEATGLLEQNPDGSNDYKKFFADESNGALWNSLAVDWDKPEKDADRDLTTLHANEGGGSEVYYGESIMLPYGSYVIVEQIPVELVNKHYELDDPKEIEIPFVPHINSDGSVTEIPSSDYLYFSEYTPQELMEKFYIRFNEETHVIQAHNHDGDFPVYKYGLEPDSKPVSYPNSQVETYYHWKSTSENAGEADGIYYEICYDRDGNVTGWGETLDGVDTMSGMTTAVNGKYAKALVPWSVLDPRQGEFIDDQGNIGNRGPALHADGTFNFVAFAGRHFENIFYSSKLRVEKLDSETGENIIHEGALFKIYAARRDVMGSGVGQVSGTGNVLFQTQTITGTRAELEARGDVEDIVWDETSSTYKGTVTEPIYDERECITMIDRTGAEVGVFRAFSTERDMVKEDGTISKEKVGYIETYQPLGAGAYVLVEIQAPSGYQKSKPIAFEIYRDETAFYEDGSPDRRTEAERYQYVKPVGGGGEIQYEDVAKIEVKDAPSKLYLHKVEDGDCRIGDENGMDSLTGVNDQGDRLTYVVRGKKEYLEARGDVEDITWDAAAKEYTGRVSKTYQEWSETVIAGTEADLIARENVKPLYDIHTGDFSGYGIRFDIPVSNAQLTLYRGLEVTKIADHIYRGVTVKWSGNQVKSITASQTGEHLQIKNIGRETTAPFYPIWDAAAIENPPINLFFYDLDESHTEREESTGELWVLDEKGNRICYVDSVSGMAYTYDEYGKMIVYEADEEGNKVVAQSIEVHQDGEGGHIYVDVDAARDELGLPLYYHSGEVTYREETWISDGTPHEITRLPFGAYIVEESGVPYDQGYIQAPGMGIILRESAAEQHFYYQNQFTKINIAKTDKKRGEEIQDAGMTLYCAERVEDDSEKGYRLKKGEIYAEWISGYQYDDNGDLKLIHGGEKVWTSIPHWIDHIPAGSYILEETSVPYEWGYVQSAPMEILVLETGDVQTYVMEDDYTSVEIEKIDTRTGLVLDDQHKATLSLYAAVLDAEGNPIVRTSKDIPGQEIPLYDPGSSIATWETGDGAEILASGREVTDEYGVTRMIYDYDIQWVDMQPDIRQAQYYITEKGTTRFEYLPVGHYVLVEEQTPAGYATAMPQLITVKDVGQSEEIQHYTMEDIPLTLEVSKTDIAGGTGEISGAHMAIFPVIDGKVSPDAAYTWISGSDGIYTEEDQAAGMIPLGYEVGDLRLHRIEYIPTGDYVLVEETTPYGFLQAVEMPFTVMDTGVVQGVQMVDEIPDGLLTIVKHDGEEPEKLLEGATFTLTNQDTGTLIETLVTDSMGIATASDALPMGYRNREGKFVPYTYVVEEIDAPDNYMLNTGRYEFQFAYQDAQTALVHLTYDAVNQINQVKISKKILTTEEELPGAEMTVTGKYTKIVLDRWVSTGQPHYIYDIPEGIYLLTEIATPGAGYAKAESMEFTVKDNMIEVPYIIMYDQPTEVQIEKVKDNSQELLPGAKLQLSREDGTAIAEWVTTEEVHRLYGLEPGSYLLTELEAPAGYRKGNPMKILVTETMEPQKFTYRNYKITRGGTIPKTPETGNLKSIGTITTVYQQGARKVSEWLTGGGIPKTGVGAWLIVLWSCGLGVCLVLPFLLSGRRKRLFAVLLCGLLGSAVWGMTAWAAPKQEAEIWSEPCAGKEELEIPSETYLDENGRMLRLESWELEEEIIEGEEKKVEKTVTYSDVEAGTALPEEIQISYGDSDTGYQISKEYPVLTHWWDHERWEVFQFPVVFHTYGADVYELGDVQIPAQAEQPGLTGHEELLLQAAGLSPEEYEIKDVIWNGEPYTDTDGVICRNALAVGEKRIRDYHVTYGGSVKIPDQKVYRTHAIYREEEIATEEKKSQAAEPETTLPEPTEETKEIIIAEQPVRPVWERMLTITIGISTLVLLCAVVVGVVWKVRR